MRVYLRVCVCVCVCVCIFVLFLYRMFYSIFLSLEYSLQYFSLKIILQKTKVPLKQKLSNKSVVEKWKDLKNLEKGMLLDGLRRCDVTDFFQSSNCYLDVKVILMIVLLIIYGISLVR